MFMVGDVKQSIYRFRQSRPELFLNKYETYKKKQEKNQNDDLKIQLFKNFRSRETILDFTNIIFQNIMSKNLGDINYNEEEYLNLGSSYPETETKQNEKIEIYVIDPLLEGEEEQEENQDEQEQWDEDQNLEEDDKEENILDAELEAKFVANKIKKLIESKLQVWDKKQEKYRDITYKDIVILLRTTKTLAPLYEQEILNLQMPVFSDSSQEYLDSIEIQNILSLLKIIDNPMQDIPLVAVMRSTIGKFTDDELIQIRLADKKDCFYKCVQKARLSVDDKLRKKIEQFLNQLEEWRQEQEYLALDELIWKIYLDTGYYNYVRLMPNGELRQANLQMLFERAKQYETASFKGLYNFLQFIEKVKSSSGDMGAAKILGENDNVIRIMSIHKSKGLEFPVVFLSGTGKQFNLTDLNKNLILQQELGIGVKYIDYEKQIQYDTLTKAAIREKVYQETLSEEMRILYVALTRAKEKLFITGITKNHEKQLKELQNQVERYEKQDGKINSILVKKQIRFIDWILLVYLYETEQLNNLAKLSIYDKQQILDICEEIDEEEINVQEILEENKIDDAKIKEIEEILNKKYNYELATKIPTKSSVTKLKQKEEKIDTTFIKPKFTKQDEETKLTGAQKGTLLHLCMQKLEIGKEYSLDNINNLIEGLVEKEMITKIEAENINKNAVLEFTKSKIWNEMKLSKEVYRERPFYITVPAKEIYGEDVEEEILVQGIIDLYYIDKNNNLVLVDYKTDFVSQAQELIQKYKVQLDLYKKALEEALNKKVSKVYIYSTYLKKEIEIS